MTTTTFTGRGPRTDTPSGSPERLGEMLTHFAYVLFVITNILSVCAVKLGVGGLPFRMWTLLAAGALLVAADGKRVLTAIKQTAKVLAVVGAAAVLGLIVSVIAHNRPADVIRQLVEIHAQAMIGVVISYTLMLRYGVPRVLAAFLIAFGVTAAFAIGQTLHIPGAWSLRERIAKITSDSIFLIPGYDPRERPMGLSYTPVLFATQACVALAAIYYTRIAQGAFRMRRIDWIVVVAALVLLVLCVITGNRSPTLGIGLFLMAFLVFFRPRLAGLLLPLALIGAGVAAINLKNLEQTGLRVTRSDSSSQNRGTLRAYGSYLISRRPLGYGLTFDSTNKWPVFYQQSIYMPNPNSIRKWVLHNYYLNILTKYGVLILFLVPWVLPRRREQLILWLAFAPYIVHIFYHNDGPLQGDFLIFYTFAAAMMLVRRPELFTARAPVIRPNPWRRAFAKPAPA